MLNQKKNVILLSQSEHLAIVSGRVCIPRPARREAKVAGEEGLPAGAVMAGGKLVGAAFGMLLTTAGDPGPRSMRLSSVASLRTW